MVRRFMIYRVVLALSNHTDVRMIAQTSVQPVQYNTHNTCLDL